MSVQYISDKEGKTTGVYIPIKEWESLKIKYKGIEVCEYDIPECQINLVTERLAEYKATPSIALDFDEAMTAIESDL